MRHDDVRGETCVRQNNILCVIYAHMCVNGNTVKRTKILVRQRNRMIVHRYPEEDLHPRTKVKRLRKTSVIAKGKLIGFKCNVLSLSTHEKFTLLESTSR